VGPHSLIPTLPTVTMVEHEQSRRYGEGKGGTNPAAGHQLSRTAHNTPTTKRVKTATQSSCLEISGSDLDDRLLATRASSASHEASSFPEADFLAFSNHNSFPVAVKKSHHKGDKMTRTDAAHKLTVRGPCTSSDDNINNNKGARRSSRRDKGAKATLSLDDQISLMLGDDEFPADDFSAFLGDFSTLEATPCPYRQLQIPSLQQSQITTTLVDLSPIIDVGVSVDDATTNTQQPQGQNQQPTTSIKHFKNKEHSNRNHMTPHSSPIRVAMGLSNIRDKIMRSPIPNTVAPASLGKAMEILDKTCASAPHQEGVLAKQLNTIRRGILLHQPESQTTSATSDTTTSFLSATSTTNNGVPISPWETQTKPKSRRTSMQKIRNLVQPLAGTKQFQKFEPSDSSDTFDFQASYRAPTTSPVVIYHQTQVSPLPSLGKKKDKIQKTRNDEWEPTASTRPHSEAPPSLPTTMATKPSKTITSTTKVIVKGNHKSKRAKSAGSGTGRDHSDLPPLNRLSQSQSSNSEEPISVADKLDDDDVDQHRQSMGDVSENSLSLSDLARSERRKVAGKDHQRRKSHNSTATTVMSSSSSLSSATKSLSSSRSKKKRADSSRAKPVVDKSLDTPLYAPAATYYSTAVGKQQQEQEQRSSTSCLLDSLELDTVHETLNEDQQEQRSSASCLLDSLELDTVHETLNEESSFSASRHDSGHSFGRSPSPRVGPLKQQQLRQQSPRSSFSSNHAATIPEDSVVAIQNLNPSFNVAATAQGQGKIRTPTNDREEGDDGSMSDSSRKKSKTSRKGQKTKKTTSTATTSKKTATTTKKKEKFVTDSAQKSQGEDVTNCRPDIDRSSSSTRSQSPDHRRRKSKMVGEDVEQLSQSQIDIKGTTQKGTNLRYDPDKKRVSSIKFGRDDAKNIPRGGHGHGKESRLYSREKIQEEPNWEDGLSYSNDRYYEEERRRGYAEVMNLTRRLMDEESMSHELGHDDAMFPYSYHYHGRPVPHPSRFVGWEKFTFWPAQYGHHNVPFHPANASLLPVWLRRRHSLGSGHSRDSVMDEIRTAMAQQYKCSTCRHCGHVVSRCHCKAHHHNMEPILDISRTRHTRERSSPDLETQLSSRGKANCVSLFDTFGIRYFTNTESREKSLSGRRLDEEVHTERLPSPGSVPLYHRPPNGYTDHQQDEQNGRVTASHQHRGRRIHGDQSESSTRIAVPSQKRGLDDEGSLQYPPRTFSFSSASGRTLEGSCVDDASLVSFAI
jgi:hypothetical protein